MCQRLHLLLVLAAVCLSPMGCVGLDRPCRSVNDDSFFNKCRIEDPPGFLTALGDTVTGWLNPVALAAASTLLLVFLPLLMLFNRSPIALHEPTAHTPLTAEQGAAFERAHLFVLNILRRVSFTSALNCGLYAVFRQRRPCECFVDGARQPVGSIYGMPSGDATVGAVAAFFFFVWTPFGMKWLSRLLGVAMIVLKCTERVAFGYHSLGQVTTGVVIGTALSAYAEYLPQYFIVLDLIAQIVIGCIALPDDSDLHYAPNDANNIVAWYFWGGGLLLFYFALTMRFYARRRWLGFRANLAGALRLICASSLSSIVIEPSTDEHSLTTGERLPLTKGATDGLIYRSVLDTLPSSQSSLLSPREVARFADVHVTLIAFFLFTVVVLLSYCLEVYGWGY